MPPFANVESTLITYRGTDAENYKFWKDSLVDFLQGKIFKCLCNLQLVLYSGI